MSSLADFYGLAPSVDEPAAPIASGVSRSDGRLALESEEFDSTEYIQNMMEKKSMKELIQHDNQMIASKRALDSEMQTLVYDNYNKFISATDMIRKMKSNVESMESQMSNLLTNMNAISKNCEGIESSLTPNRTKVDNLLGVSRLLKRLEFLFELPGKLKRSIQLGAYEQAVRYFRTASAILEQYRHHKSFHHIRTESESIIADLKVKLRSLIQSPSIAIDQQMSYVGMLVLDLNEPDSKELIENLVSDQKNRFQSALQKAVELAQKGANQRKASISISTHDKDADAPPAASSVDLLALLQHHFLTPFVIFVDTYLSTLVRPYESKVKQLSALLSEQRYQLADQTREENERIARGDKPLTASEQSSLLSSSTVESTAASLASLTSAIALSQDSLNQIATDLFQMYFTIVRRELIKRATIKDDDDASQVILQFTATLKSFYSGLATSITLLPKAKLTDRAQELVHHALTHCVESVCDHALVRCIAMLVDAHRQLADFRGPANPAAAAIITPQSLSLQLRKKIEEAFGLLVVVLSTRDYLPESVSQGLSFTELARAHANQLMIQLAGELSFRAPKRADGPVYDSPQPTALSKALDARIARSTSAASSVLAVDPDRQSRMPLFYLFLSSVCVAQESRDIAATIKTLSKFFPPPPQPRGTRTQTNRDSDAALTQELNRRMKENTHALLLRFVETQGFQVTDIVRKYLVRKSHTIILAALALLIVCASISLF